MNFSGVMPSNLDISTLDAWAADYLGQEQKSIQDNFRFFKVIFKRSGCMDLCADS